MDSDSKCPRGFDILMLVMCIVFTLGFINVEHRIGALGSLEIQKTKEICIHKVVGE